MLILAYINLYTKDKSDNISDSFSKYSKLTEHIQKEQKFEESRKLDNLGLLNIKILPL